MCTHLVINPGTSQALIEAHVRDTHRRWAEIQSIRFPQGNWDKVRSLPFGGFRRVENLPQTSANEAVMHKGKPVLFHVPVAGYGEHRRAVKADFDVKGLAEFRLHRTRDYPRGAWVIVTCEGDKGPADRFGNVRAPWLAKRNT